MFVKSITISGFKSYRDAAVAGPFDPGHNVVVGRNGSGKSNFFDAVRFLLSDAFASLRSEERVALLHEGAGASVLSAYVEMVFDNSDGRLPFDKDTVALRRMVGLQKDEYLLDRKNVTRTEVFNLLESAGFSRSNPYYIVQQGKVAALCAMSDRSRLDLLKEVAGTRVYDERREESLRIMDETDAKREKISEVVHYIEARLAELDSEKDELKAFQNLDRERRALEYTIYVKELDDAKAALDAITLERTERSTAGHDINSRLVALQNEIATADRDLETAKAELSRIVKDRAALDDSRRAAVATVAKLNVDLADAQQAAVAAEETVRNARSELAALEKLAEDRRGELIPLQLEFEAARENERTARKEAAELEAGILALKEKADRGSRFKSVEQRNAHLREEIKAARKAADTSRKLRTKAEADVVRLEGALASSSEKIASREVEIRDIETRTADIERELAELRKHRDSIHAQRHEKWRQDAQLDSKMNAMSGKIKALEAAKRSAFGSGTFHAVSTVMDAANSDLQNLGPDRVFGALVDLFQVDEKFTIAAEVTAGNSLTHIVVDTDKTAARLVRVLQDRCAGRATFIPINRLAAERGRNDSRAQVSNADSIPLINKIRCDDRIRPAVDQVFGRTLITRTVDVASQMSRMHDVNCVTLDGDQVNKQGALTGGFLDLSRSKIDATRDLRSGQEELAKIQPQAFTARAAAAEIDAELSKLLGEIQQGDATHRSLSSKAHRLRNEIEQLGRYAKLDKENIPKAKELKINLDETIAGTDKRIAELESEVRAPMTSVIPVVETEKLQSLQAEADSTRERAVVAAAERTRIEIAIAAIQSELESNLEKRCAELRRIIASGTIVPEGMFEAVSGFDADGEASGKHDLEELQLELASAKTELHSSEAALKSIDERIVELEASVAKYVSVLNSNKEEELLRRKQLEDDRIRAESLFSRRTIHSQKKSDAERKIRELGSLPADFEKYRSFSIAALLKKLKKTNESLATYSHVNKKALDQFISFTEQRETLRKRREELESGATAIRQLIESLDQRKDEDILRTFKGVSKFFAEVFSELVAGGRASLVMLKSSIGDGDVSVGASTSKMRYTGVAMKVTFTTSGEAYLLQQLSGGQKSIVALALIFAIQRLDPAPFYLFDEIDANLDATYRQAVANVIKKQAGGTAQFITTTFRPEFVHAGDMWFGVTHRNKVSAVQEVTRDVALTFINKGETVK
jgi:structural maintenance of chromosome 3 (chondroitin sulfate proteoglycan 6)